MQRVSDALLVVDGSQDGSFIEFSGNPEYAWSQGPDAEELTPPALAVHQVEQDDSFIFVVAPAAKTDEEVAEMVSQTPANGMPQFTTRESAEDFADNARDRLRKDGRPAKPAKTVGDLTNLTPTSITAALKIEATKERINQARLKRQDNARRRAAEKISDEVMPQLATMVRDGKTEEEIRAVIDPMFEQIGQEVGFGLLTDADSAYEDALVRNYLAAEVQELGMSLPAFRAAAVAGVMSGEYGPEEVPFLMGLSAGDIKNLVEVAKDPDAYLSAQVSGAIGQDGTSFVGLLRSTKLGGRDPRLSDGRFVARIYEDFQAEVQAMALENIEGEITPEAYAREVNKLTKNVTSQLDILDRIVAVHVMEPDANIDAVGLLQDSGARTFLVNAFRDQSGVDFDESGNMRTTDPDFWPAMVKWAEEWQRNPANKDRSYGELVFDFVSGGEAGFESYYRNTKVGEAEVAEGQEEPLTEFQKQALEEKKDEQRQALFEVLPRGGKAFMGSLEVSPEDRQSMLEARGLAEGVTGVAQARQDLAAIDVSVDSKVYRRNPVIKKYVDGRNDFMRRLQENDQARNVVGQKVPADPNGYSVYSMPDSIVQRQLDERGSRVTITHNYRKYLFDTLEHRADGGFIDGQRSSLSLDEIRSGKLRIPYRDVRIEVPREALHPAYFPMVPDAAALESYSAKDWNELYEALAPGVQESLTNAVTSGVADDIPDLLKGLQEDLFYLTYRIDLEK